MIRRVTSAFFLVTALGHASAATASDALLKEKLAPEIGAVCHSGTISAAALGSAIYASQVAPLTQEYAWIAGGPPAIAKAAFEGTSKDNQASLYLLRRLTETWLAPSDGGANFLPLNDGGIEIRHANGTAAGTAEAEEALTDILSGRDSRFVFRCLQVAAPATPAEMPQEKASPISISIAKSPDDLTLPLDKKSFAEVAYVNDKTKDDRSISIYATVGASLVEGASKPCA